MLLRRCLLLCCALMGLMAPLAYANTEPRLALLIGNATYKASPLANPVNDVRLMEGALKEAGFTVIKAENASIRDMRRLVRDFGDKLKATGGVGLFYFAGHGVQVRGENFLVSTDSDIRNEDEVADEALNASVILEKMQTAGNRMNLIILDACRNNPFSVKSRSATSGLATMSAPSGSLVAYSTAPGSVASDGSGKNGLYTEHLAKVLRQPGLPVEEVFKQVRAAVRKDSNNQQTPWENTALEGQFYFKPGVQLAAPLPNAAPAAAPSAASQSAAEPVSLELAFWDSVKNSQRPAELQAYIERFPNGTFATLAKSRLQELPGGVVKPAGVVPARIADSIPSQAAGTSIGTLELTDSLTGLKRNVEVTVKESNAEKTVYSTGDEVAKDGRVLRIALGDALLRVTSGALWTIPVKAGTEGEAKLESWNGSFRSHSPISWRAVAAGNNQVRIEATATIGSSYGKFSATYSANRPLPDAFATQIRGNPISAELKLAKSSLQELSGGAATPASLVSARIADSIPSQAAGASIGTLVITDSLTGLKRNVEVTVTESNAERTVYSTGDEVAKDGRVVRIALGNVLLGVVSGALWAIPVKAGTQGEAKLERLNVTYKGPGSISWRAVAASDDKVRIEATVSYANQSGFGAYVPPQAYGKLSITYGANQPLPDVRSNFFSAELKLR
jgi:hypothetical protein